MMYNNKLAVAIKSNGKVLREFGESVYVPFGTEYSILIKNLNSVRALVRISIDGTDVGDGEEFVIPANDSVEFERFIKNGNMKKGNRFKFIERTSNIEEHRGIDIEDGLVRIEYEFEKVVKFEPWHWHHQDVFYFVQQHRDFYGSSGTPGWLSQPTITCNAGDAPTKTFSAQTTRSMDITNSVAKGAVTNTGGEPVQVNYCATEPLANEEGITVPGSISDQQFRTVASFQTEDETHVMILKLLGETEDNKRVKKAVTVKAKPKCTTCGKVNKATAKFCTECGTSLTIV